MGEDKIVEVLAGGGATTALGYIFWYFKSSQARQARTIEDLLERLRKSETKIELLEAEKIDEKEARRITIETIEPLVKDINETKVTSKTILEGIQDIRIFLAKKFPDL